MDTKKCCECGETKPLTEFYKRGGKRSDVQHVCKPCSCASARQWARDNRQRQYAYRQKNPRWTRRGNLKTKRMREADIARALDSYEAAVACQICGHDFSKHKKCVDHDHETGAFRDILCNACNIGLGGFKDSGALLLNAISYLMKHRASATSATSDDPYSLFPAAGPERKPRQSADLVGD